MNDSFSAVSPDQTGATHNEISARAQLLWENLGRPVGRDEEIWLQAERELRRPATPSAPSATMPTESAPAEFSNQPRAKSSAAPRKPSSRNSKAAAR